MTDMHLRNPVFVGDDGPPTAIQARRSGIHQTGRLVVVDNPISYIVEPGRYYPFLSLRGHRGDPTTEALEEQLRLGDMMGYEPPSNQEPHHVTPGYQRRINAASTRGAVPGNISPLSNTTLLGTGPEGLPLPVLPEGVDFFSGVPGAPAFTRGL